MPEEKQTQDPEEDKGQEEEKEQEKEEKSKEKDKEEEKEKKDPVDEQGDLFSEGFADATKKIKEDAKKDPGEDSKEKSEEKSGKGDKDKSGEEKDGSGNEGKKTTEKEPEEKGKGGEEGKAEKEIKERAERLKKIMEKSEKEGEEEDPPPKKKAAKSKEKEKEKEPEKEKAKEKETIDPLEGVEFTEGEKDLLEDMPELKDMLGKIIKNAMGGKSKEEGIPQEIIDHLNQQDDVIANLRTQVALSRLVPDYEELVYDGNKMVDDGEGNQVRAPNPEFWTWLKEQPELYQGLALSENPRDNAAVLKFYKEERAKKQLSEKDKQTKEKANKTKDLHSHSANASKTAKRKSSGVDEDDFSGGFAEATKKIAAERQ